MGLSDVRFAVTLSGARGWSEYFCCTSGLSRTIAADGVGEHDESA
jgi:hypothetical protein